jgi:hypothetical protein
MIVHGRLVYPVYGMRVESPDLAEFVVTVFYGGLHAVSLMFAVATFVLSASMRRNASYGTAVARLGFVTAAVDVVGAYPWLIGSIGVVVSRLFFAAWFVAVGARMVRRERTPPST